MANVMGVPRLEFYAKCGKKWVKFDKDTESGDCVWERLARDLMWRYLAKANYAKKVTETVYGNVRTVTVYDYTDEMPPMKRVYTLPN